jgi:hypothetical protein
MAGEYRGWTRKSVGMDFVDGVGLMPEFGGAKAA